MNTRRDAKVVLVIGPDASMSPALAGWFFASLCLVSLATAALFVVRGMWPVLPFAGLELAAVGAALLVTLRRNRYREVISIEAQRVTVEFGIVGRGPQLSVAMRRSAARAFAEDGAVVISGDGQRLLVGRCLRPQERTALCRRLRELFSPLAADRDAQDAGRVPAH